MPDADPVIQFPQDPNDLHVGVLQEKTSLSVQGWVFGRWLEHMKATGAWQQVTLGAARFPDWNTYLGKGVGMSDVQARKYLACAWFPSYVLKQLGIERCATLRQICELTEVDETAEQALALQLPLPDGSFKTIASATPDEAQAAYQLMRDGRAHAKRPDAPPKLGEHAVLLQQVAGAVEQWLEPRQVNLRSTGGQLVVDVRGVPREVAPEVFEALAAALRARR